MTTAYFPVPVFRALTSAGLPLAGGLLYTYAAGTTTPQTTYAADGTTPNANPVVLDSTGTATIRCDSSLSYKFVLKDSGGATQWTIDNYLTGIGTSPSFSGTATIGTLSVTGNATVGGNLAVTGTTTLTGALSADQATIKNLTVTPTAGRAATFNGVSGTHSVKIADSANTTFNAGYLELPVSGQATPYTAVLADAGKCLYYNGTGAAAFTIPANASVAYPVGTTLTFVNDATGATNMTIAITTDTLVMAANGLTGSRTLAQYGRATAHKVTSTRWYISGTGLT
jgi:hypothetical protein